MSSPRRTSSNRNGATLSRGLMYPGHDLSIGVKDTASVRKVQQRLNEIGCGPVSVSGSLDSQTRAAVQLFQARSVDAHGQSLKIDGVVGPLTWAALFGSATFPSIVTVAISPLVRSSLNVATSQVGVMEEPPGSNRGPRVDEYLRQSASIPPKTAIRGVPRLSIGPSHRRWLAWGPRTSSSAQPASWIIGTRRVGQV